MTTPGIVIIAAWLGRLLATLALLPSRFPLACLSVAASVAIASAFGWVALAATTAVTMGVLRAWRWRWPDSFRRCVALRALAAWRWVWVYRRHWQPVLVVAGLAESYQERRYLPRIRRVTCTAWSDRVRVTLVAGTQPGDVEQRVAELAHGFGAPSCRVTVRGPRDVVVEFPRRDLLATPLAALAVADSAGEVDLAALPVGRQEDGRPWRLRLHGTHVLTIGVTGSGKGSVIWSAIRAMLPAIEAGTAQIWAVDPKRMELSYGRFLFAAYADTGEAALELLEAAVAVMHERAARYAGTRRGHTPTTDDPFIVVAVDEVAFLTAYHPDRDVRRRAENALATLTSQGRSVGLAVLAALQDPRKEVLNLRNLFPDKIALRLDEASQVDMVLGEGARERGANAHLIDPDMPGGLRASGGLARPGAGPGGLRQRWRHRRHDGHPHLGHRGHSGRFGGDGAVGHPGRLRGRGHRGQWHGRLGHAGRCGGFGCGGSVMPTPTGKSTRVERMAQPLAREVAEQVAADKGVCIRPVSLRRTDLDTGASEIVDVPCGATLESRCPACATRKRSIRRTQCEEGWHLTEEPTVEPDEPSEQQRGWVEQRA